MGRHSAPGNGTDSAAAGRKPRSGSPGWFHGADAPEGPLELPESMFDPDTVAVWDFRPWLIVDVPLPDEDQT